MSLDQLGTSLTLEAALGLSARLLGFSLLVQTVELLVLRDSLSERGIWRMSTPYPELARLPGVLRALCLSLFPYPRFVPLLALQLCLSLLLLCFGLSLALLPAGACALLINMRFRGTFNGGSDAMSMLTLLCLAVAACSKSAPTAQLGCMGYLTLQVCLSYFVAGWVKLRQRSWRNGTALREFAALPRYAVPEPALRWLRRPLVARTASLLLLGFECSFPLALLAPNFCAVYLGLSLIFHLANAALFGLNRFLLAWLATYPALLYVSQLGPLA